MHEYPQSSRPLVGSLFAGIGGFDLGFERAGFSTAWQVELAPLLREVLALRFPHAQQWADVRECGAHNLRRVDVLCAGFPCQDLSSAGACRAGGRAGLVGQRSGLFREVCRIARELEPRWLVLENVVGLLTCHAGRDFGAVIASLADLGYVGCWRVLDSQYFGVAQGRRRVFLVAGLGERPPAGLLSDAAAVAAVPRTFSPSQDARRPADAAPAYCLLAKNRQSVISLVTENLVCHEGGRRAMVERQRVSEAAGLPLGLDAANHAEVRAAGNAVCVPVAQWIAAHLMAHMQGAGFVRPQPPDPQAPASPETPAPSGPAAP